MAYVRRRGPTRHPYVEDPEWEGYCRWCHLTPQNAVHDLPERTEEEQQIEARRIGESA